MTKSSQSQNGHKKITIREVAAAADVSLSTVSRAMHNDPRARPETTQRVLKVARELGYYPDSLAMGMRRRKTNTIGIIFNDLNNPFYTEILSAIGKKLNESRYSLLISYSDYDSEQEYENIASMFSRRVDGIIMSPIDDHSENIKVLQGHRDSTEFVLIDCLPWLDSVPCVYSEHGNGASLATEHLVRRGHRDILLMTGPPERCMADHFIGGYTSVLRAHDVPIRSELIVHCNDLTIDGGYRTFKEVLTGGVGSSNRPDFTAVVAISDMLAIGIYKVANELGFRIPDDYSVIGYDDIEMASALSPPLTTIHQPRRRIATESLNILLHNIESDDKISDATVFLPHLVKRGSVRSLI